MLSGLWQKETRRSPLAVIPFALCAFPGAAAAGPLELIGQISSDPRWLLIIGILAGSIGFSVYAAVVFLRASQRARKAARRLQTSTDRLEHERAALQSILAAEPQTLVRWDASGEPSVVTATLDPGLGAPTEAASIVRYAAWLEHDSAQALQTRVETLLDKGEAFTLMVKTQEGAHLEADGRPGSAGAILKFRDLEERRDELLKLYEQHEHLSQDVTAARALYDALPMPVWFRDADGKLEWVNQAYARAVEASDSREVFEQQIEFLNSRERASAERCISEGESFTRRIHAIVSGERCAFDVIVLPVGQASAGIAIDVAALETAESELNRHIEEHTRILDRIPTAVAIFSPDQRLTYYNQAFVDLWKLDDDWLAGGPREGEILDALRQRRCLPEQADYRAWKEKQLSHYASGASREERWHLPDGRTIHMVANHGADGSATYLYENITEELALKSRYNALIRVQKETLDHLREGVAVFATDGRLKLFNPAFAVIWKLDPGELEDEPHIDDVIARCRDLLDDDAAWKEVKQAITSIDDQREPIEGQLSRPDGAMLAYAGLPLPDGATLLTYVDITDSKRVENALIERNEALVAADRLKSDFISHVSYELRTPLTNIIGFAELLSSPQTGPLNEKQRDYLNDIRTSSDSLLAIINDILDLATIDAGALELDLEPVRVREVIDQAVLGVRERIKQGGLDLDLRIDDDVQEFVADGQRVTQVLFNLLSNAIGFSEPGSTVTLACRRDSDMIAMTVEDKGRGIPEDYQENAFDRFETRSQGSRHRGAGLGLAIVKNLVELHGGDVTLDSRLGEGTRVTVRFPAEGAAARQSPPAAEQADDAQRTPERPPSAATG